MAKNSLQQLSQLDIFKLKYEDVITFSSGDFSQKTTDGVLVINAIDPSLLKYVKTDVLWAIDQSTIVTMSPVRANYLSGTQLRSKNPSSGASKPFWTKLTGLQFAGLDNYLFIEKAQASLITKDQIQGMTAISSQKKMASGFDNMGRAVGELSIVDVVLDSANCTYFSTDVLKSLSREQRDKWVKNFDISNAGRDQINYMFQWIATSRLKKLRASQWKMVTSETVKNLAFSQLREFSNEMLERKISDGSMLITHAVCIGDETNWLSARTRDVIRGLSSVTISKLSEKTLLTKAQDQKIIDLVGARFCTKQQVQSWSNNLIEKLSLNQVRSINPSYFTSAQFAMMLQGDKGPILLINVIDISRINEMQFAEISPDLVKQIKDVSLLTKSQLTFKLKDGSSLISHLDLSKLTKKQFALSFESGNLLVAAQVANISKHDMQTWYAAFKSRVDALPPSEMSPLAFAARYTDAKTFQQISVNDIAFLPNAVIGMVRLDWVTDKQLAAMTSKQFEGFGESQVAVTNPEVLKKVPVNYLARIISNGKMFASSVPRDVLKDILIPISLGSNYNVSIDVLVNVSGRVKQLLDTYDDVTADVLAFASEEDITRLSNKRLQFHLNEFDDKHIKYLSNSQVYDLSFNQLVSKGAVTGKPIFQSLTDKQTPNISANVILDFVKSGSLPLNWIAWLSSVQLNAGVYKTLTADQKAVLTDGQLFNLDASLFNDNELRSKRSDGRSLFSHLKKVSGVSVSFIQSLTMSELSDLTADQLNSMSFGQLISINAFTKKTLLSSLPRPSQIGSFDFTNRLNVIPFLTKDIIPYIDLAQLRALFYTQSLPLDAELADGSYVGQYFSYDQVRTFREIIIELLCYGVQKNDIVKDIIRHMAPGSISAFKAEDFSEQVALNTNAVLLHYLAENQVPSIDRGELAKITPSTFNGFSAFGGLDQSSMSYVSREQFQATPIEYVTSTQLHQYTLRSGETLFNAMTDKQWYNASYDQMRSAVFYLNGNGDPSFVRVSAEQIKLLGPNFFSNVSRKDLDASFVGTGTRLQDVMTAEQLSVLPLQILRERFATFWGLDDSKGSANLLYRYISAFGINWVVKDKVKQIYQINDAGLKNAGTVSIKDVPLYTKGGPSPFDIDQNSVGDCYLMASLGALADVNPDAIRNSIFDLESVYLVRIGNECVLVDKTIPSGAAGFASGAWVAVMESAFAEYYARIKGLASSNAYYDALDNYSPAARNLPPLGLLTGGNYVRLQNRDTVIKYIEPNVAPVVFESHDNIITQKDQSGVATLYGTHGYVALEYNAITDKVLLLNPWGTEKIESGRYLDSAYRPKFEMDLDDLLTFGHFSTADPNYASLTSNIVQSAAAMTDISTVSTVSAAYVSMGDNNVKLV